MGGVGPRTRVRVWEGMNLVSSLLGLPSGRAWDFGNGVQEQG